MSGGFGVGPFGLGPFGESSGVARAAYLIEIGWGQTPGGLFTFGTSQFGSSTDRFAADNWSASFAGAHDNVSGDVREFTIDRGRDNDLTTMKAGTSTLTLRDATGLYNPLNPASPLAGNLDTDKPVRVSALHNGTTYPLYYGFISDIEGDPTGRGKCQITCVDFFDKLDRQNPIVTPAAGLTDGQILGLILDWFRWTDPAMRSLGTGDTITASFTRADGTRSGVGLVEEMLASERGVAFVDHAGAVKYMPRSSRYAAVSAGMIDRTMTAFQSGRTNANIVNQWTVQRTDMAGNPVGVAQTAGDATSQQRHGIIADTLTTPYLNTDAQALSLAQYMVFRTASGLSLVYEVPINIADSSTLTQVLRRDLGDRVTLTLQPRNMPEFTDDFFIEAIQHSVQSAGKPRHACTWRVSAISSQTPFRFGVSPFGASDVLWY